MRFLDHDEADDPILSVVNLIDLFLVVIGILMIVMLIFYPRGLIYIPRDIKTFFQKRASRAKKGEA